MNELELFFLSRDQIKEKFLSAHITTERYSILFTAQYISYYIKNAVNIKDNNGFIKLRC